MRALSAYPQLIRRGTRRGGDAHTAENQVPMRRSAREEKCREGETRITVAKVGREFEHLCDLGFSQITPGSTALGQGEETKSFGITFGYLGGVRCSRPFHC